MLMVNFYLTMYAICRATDETIIFAKGAEDVSTPEGSLHATAIGCFSNIRERVFSDSEGFYLEEIAEILDVRGTKLIKMIEVDGKDEKGNTVPTIKMDGAKEWKDLRDNLMSSRRPEVLDRIIIEYLDLNREEEKDVNLRDLAKAFVDYSKKRASSVRKISSVFSVQGQQAKFVFPKGGSHKYYGMSGELVQLLLKLCLAEREKDSDYLTLEAFLLWLENKYGIFIASSDKLTGFLKSNSIRIPSFSEFELNTQAFIHTLEGISAVQKMSDKTYIVHDSGKVGVFDW